MAQPARSFEQPHDRNSRLYLLGLDETVMEKMVVHGLTAKQACSPFSPTSYPGYTQWAETTIASRRFLTPKDWTPDDSHGFPRVVSPDGKIAITVATGDEHTGIAADEPRTKYPKGPETTSAVEVNAQPQIPGFPLSKTPEKAPASQRETWMLLVTTNHLELRYELSLPKGQDKEGRVVEWSERIIFPPIDIESLPARDDDGGDDDDGLGGIDVPVERI
jgi:hypothetical protein